MNIINKNQASKFYFMKGITLFLISLIGIGGLCLLFAVCIVKKISVFGLNIQVIINLLFLCFMLFMAYSFLFISLEFIKQSKEINKYPDKVDINLVSLNDDLTVSLFNRNWPLEYNDNIQIILDCNMEKIFIPKQSLIFNKIA